MAESPNQVGIVMTPPLKSFVAAIDLQKVVTSYAETAASNAASYDALFYPE